MNNKIAMVNKELHNKLFEEPEIAEEEEEQHKIYRRHKETPELLLRSMIKKGLTNTQPIPTRPKTAYSNLKRTSEGKNTIVRLKSIETAHQSHRNTHRREDLISQSNVEFEFNTTHPKEFNEFQQILNKMKWQRDQQDSRKKLKLQKYGQRKFRYAWRKCNIPQ